MSILEESSRSTLVEREDGWLYRIYRDTLATSHVFPAHIDPRGVRRCSGNRRIDSLRDGAFRGSTAAPSRRTPPSHLRETLAVVCRCPRDIERVAQHLGVARNTAWSYACRVVETWPTAWECAECLVDDDLMIAVHDTADLSGSLRALMGRLPMHAHHALRESHDRYAHLRLARLCAEARRQVEITPGATIDARGVSAVPRATAGTTPPREQTR